MPDSTDIELLLEAVKTRQKFPRMYAKALQDIHSARVDATERIFFEAGGVAAWAAYVLTKKAAEGNGHTLGKAKRSRLLERIEGHTADERRSLAEQVTAAIEPDRERIEHIINTARRQLPRVRQSSHQSTLPDCTTDAEDYSAERREGDTESMNTAEPGANETGTFQPDAQQLAGASTTGCAQLFPPYFAAALRKTPDSERPSGELVAAVFLILRSHSDCELKMEIMANKVEYIAKELFNAHLETTDGFRYLYLAGTTRARPDPNMILAGCRPASISHIFGQQIADAVSSTAIYKRDIKEGRDCTDGVTMVVPQTASETAIISITVPAQAALSIKDQLYR